MRKERQDEKFLPLHLAIFSIALFCGLIAQHEWHLRDSQSIYVELAPADPRSILQGDYMALNYDLHFSALAAEKRLEQSEPKISIQDFENQSRVLSYVQLDEKGRVVRSSFDRSALDQPRSAQLILKNPQNTFEGLYPATNSFMFAEGLEPCYRDAKFAELKLKENGEALLADLVDQNLKSLNCENRKSWWQGN